MVKRTTTKRTGGAKRPRPSQINQKPKGDNKGISGITNPTLKRLCLKSNNLRISGDVYPNLRTKMKHWVEAIIRDAVVYTLHSKRKTVSAKDVVASLKKNGKILYGFGA